MRKLYFMIGSSGSGKSSKSSELATSSNGIRVSADDFPGLYKPDGSICFPKLKLAHAWCLDMVREAMGRGQTIYLDNTNLQPGFWIQYLELAIQYGYKVQFVLPTHLYFHYENPEVPQEREAQIDFMCKVRSKGEKVVPADVIKRMERDFNTVKVLIEENMTECADDPVMWLNVLNVLNISKPK